MKQLRFDPKSITARRLAALGVEVWIHGRYYALVADAGAPHGYRLIADASTLTDLLARARRALRRRA